MQRLIYKKPMIGRSGNLFLLEFWSSIVLIPIMFSGLDNVLNQCHFKFYWMVAQLGDFLPKRGLQQVDSLFLICSSSIRRFYQSFFFKLCMMGYFMGSNCIRAENQFLIWCSWMISFYFCMQILWKLKTYCLFWKNLKAGMAKR